MNLKSFPKKITLPRKKQKRNDESDMFKRLISQLNQNNMTEFVVGFERGEIQSKKEVQKLINAVRDKYCHTLSLDKHSCLRTIRIGWRLPPFAIIPILKEVVPLLLKAPAQVETLHLCLHAWVPEATLESIVSCTTLTTVDIRSTKIRNSTRCHSDPRHNRLNTNNISKTHRRKILDVHHLPTRTSKVKSTLSQSTHEKEASPLDGNLLVDDCIVRIVPHISNSVHTLRLVDCDLHHRQVELLAHCLSKKRNVRSLSLRHNQCLNGAWKYFMKFPFIKSLDLSVCDMSVNDCWNLAIALQKNHSLQNLSVAGNYRMSVGIPQLVQAAATHLVHLDCSFCDINNKIQMQVFDTLATTPHCTLQTLKMQATKLSNVGPLVNCILNNQSLEAIVVDHPRSPYPLDSAGVQSIVDAMGNNFLLSDLKFNVFERHESLLGPMYFWLELNRCGRRVLLQDNNLLRPIPYSIAISRAVETDDNDMVYWMLRHGVQQL